jgi:LmbE family N-acetylglucosaminyl deacetylase
MQEARAAARALHVPTTDEFFLGYPDGGLQSMAEANFEVIYTSPHTALRAVSYEGTVAPGSSFKGRTLELQLGHIVDDWKPTFILAPSVLDQHPDHRATGQFAVRVLQERHELGRLRVWIVHGGAWWPWPRGWHPSASLQAPGVATALAWTSLPLDAAAVNDKRAALAAHRTQMFGLEQHFLLAFARRNELFAIPPAP